MPHITILADDLTGAADAAAPFAARGARTRVRFGPDSPRDEADVLSICSATRDLSAQEAAAAVQATLAEFRNAEPFKKIDSVLRGNTLQEIKAAVEACPEHVALIAPAFPALGRCCIDGAIHATDVSGLHTLPLHVPLTGSGLDPVWLPAGPNLVSALSRNLAESRRVFLCESRTQTDLDDLVVAARALKHRILWIGSGGLAHALAAALYPVEPRRPAAPPWPAVLFTGSTHPVTEAQLAPLLAHPRVLPIARKATASDKICKVVTDHNAQTVVLNGGDTALHVCGALGIHALELEGEYAPGIPQARACGGPFAGRTVILKSGGFGDHDLLVRLLEKLS